jgi:hypothetical protein
MTRGRDKVANNLATGPKWKLQKRSIQINDPDKRKVLHIVASRVATNPENDPFGVDLESTLALGINLVCNFPSLESYSMGVVGFTTLFCVSAVPKEVSDRYFWSCFDASNCPCKTRGAERTPAALPGSLFGILNVNVH